MGKVDPWMLDSETAKQTKDETTLKTKGEICPRRNHSIGEKCMACLEVSAVYQSTVDGDPKRKMAGKKSAKASYFANVVLPGNVDKAIVLEMGKKIGDKVLDQNLKNEWLDIAHPKAGMGRELKITKTKGAGDLYPSYSIDPILEKASWDVPDQVLENLINLDQGNVIEILENETEEIFKVSSLKVDESLTIRLCPPWKEARDRGEKRILTPVFRHWNVSREEIENGGIDFGETEIQESEKREDIPAWEGAAELDTGMPEPQSQVEAPVEQSPAKTEREPCFGKSNVFEEDDEECVSCTDFKPCLRAVMKGGG